MKPHTEPRVGSCAVPHELQNTGGVCFMCNFNMIYQVARMSADYLKGLVQVFKGNCTPCYY